MPYYTRAFNPQPTQRVGSTDLKNEFQSVEAGFTAAEAAVAAKASLASPAFTGTPTAPTAAVSTDSTQIATTAFVQDVFGTVPSGSLPALAGNAGKPLVVDGGETGVQWGSFPTSLTLAEVQAAALSF